MAATRHVAALGKRLGLQARWVAAWAARKLGHCDQAMHSMSSAATTRLGITMLSTF